MERINERARDLSKSPARSVCNLPYSSCHVMTKGRSPGLHRVATLHSWTTILRLTDWSRLFGETVTGRPGAWMPSPCPGVMPIFKTVDDCRPDSRRALSTCSRLSSESRPRACVRGRSAWKSTSSTACSSARIGGGSGKACRARIALPQVTTPSTKPSKTGAGCRHRVGTFAENGGEGTTCCVSRGCFSL